MLLYALKRAMPMHVKPMLAIAATQNDITKRLPMYGQPKVDGIRMFIHGGYGIARSLKPIRSKPIQQRLEDLLSNSNIVINGWDGEIVAGAGNDADTYRRTSSSVMSFDKDDDFTFYVFDNILQSTTPYSQRKKWLEDYHSKHEFPEWIKLLETRLLHTYEEVLEFNSEMLEKGYEGIILRDPNGFYKYGRSTTKSLELVKVKIYTDTEARIVGFEEELHNTNEANYNELGYTERSSHKENLYGKETLGAIKARGVFPDGKRYTVSIGTGFTKAERQEIWDNRESYLGKFVKFKYFPVGMKDRPRHPVFLGFRDADDMCSEIVAKQLNLL